MTCETARYQPGRAEFRPYNKHTSGSRTGECRGGGGCGIWSVGNSTY